ncbi:MAG: thioesterase II family protein [Rubripirellula sp.]
MSTFDPQLRLIHDPEPAAAEVYWITHAGGGTNTLAHRARTACADMPIRIQTPWMPAREEHTEATFAGDLNEMASCVADTIEQSRQASDDELPFAVVGHSFGSVFAYRVTCELVRRGVSPHRLVTLSFPSPEDIAYDRQLHSLSDEMLVREVDELFGGIPAAVLEDETALHYFVPGLRFDLALLEGYRHLATDPLPVPIVAICGTDDRAVDMAGMNQWQNMTTAAFRLRAMPGDHFFPLERMSEILQVALWDVLPG